MQTTNTGDIDKFEQHLQSMIQELKQCQQSKGVDSCSKCENFIGCKLRDDYVKSVYNSMSKGDTGGFEF